MSKFALYSVVTIACIGIAGAVYIKLSSSVTTKVPEPSRSASEKLGSPQPKDEVQQKIDGIGSTRALKPVPIPNGPAR